jgi:salicylate hydroxylase
VKIAVIGAGVSGLTFATAMRRQSPGTEVTLYERDPSSDSRPQGYAIGLRNGLGLKALESLGLRDDVVGKDAIRVTNFEITDQNGKELLALPSTNDGPNATYRVQRSHLMDVLREGVGDTPIHYGMRCTAFAQTAREAVATFEGGQRVTADYVLGCDGVASAIRQQLIGDAKRYLGLTSIHAETPIRVDHPLLDGGYFMMLGRSGTSFFCYRQPFGAFWSYTVRAANEAEIAAQPKDALLKRVADETSDWHELVRTLVKNAAVETVAVRGYYDKEPARRVIDGRILVIGDAAHPMSPFQGQGANMAIIDAVKVAEFFSGDVTAPERAAATDEEIVKRGRKVVLESRGNARRYHESRPMARANRNLVFHIANFFIRTFSKPARQ